MPVNEARLYGNSDEELDAHRVRTASRESTGKGSTAYDPAAVPEWARESVACTARDHPGNLPFVLGHVAEIEDARRYLAAHPPVAPDPPEDPREYLHLLAVAAHRALASGRPAPGVDPIALDQGIRAACGGSDPIDELCESWLAAAREHGITVDGESGDTLLATVIPVITAAFWSGLTTGHYAVTRECSTPRRFLPYFERAATGSRG
jgi:hypothetical protein